MVHSSIVLPHMDYASIVWVDVLIWLIMTEFLNYRKDQQELFQDVRSEIYQVKVCSIP